MTSIETLFRLKERDLCTFGDTLLKIAMTYLLSRLRVLTITIYSGDIYLRACYGKTTSPPKNKKGILQ